MRSRACRCALLLAALALLHPAAARADGAALAWLAEHGVDPPDGSRLTVCHGFGCTYRAHVALSPAVAAAIARRMSVADAAAERRAVGDVVALVERVAAPELGGPPDLPGNGGHAQEAGQMDCIDESTNTTGVLLYLEARGLLRHHVVSGPVARGFVTPEAHATAVLAERRGGRLWAVDSWVRASGERPDILPLEAWFARHDGAEEAPMVTTSAPASAGDH